MNALKDLVVLDLSRFEAGPRCTYLLGQLGAYILKVEKDYTGDDERLFPPMYNKESLAFPTLNLNKHSLSMDLRNPKAKKILFDLLPHVDVVIQNFRAGTIEKMGLDWETIHKINPRIIMANNSGFGQTGPYRDRAGVDAVAQSESGLAGSFMRYGGKPIQTGGYPLDHQTALALTVAILAALNQRDRTGIGQYLEVDLFSIGLNLFSPDLCLYSAAGTNQAQYYRCPNDFYKDKNGNYLHISCPDHLWASFKTVVGKSELDAPEFSNQEKRVAAREKLNLTINSWTGLYDREEVRQLLEPAGIGVGIVKGYDDLLNDKYLEETNYYRQVDVPYVGKVPYPCLPFTMSGGEASYRPAPKIGEQNREILQKFLGMDASEIQSLTEEGVLYQGEHACMPPKNVS